VLFDRPRPLMRWSPGARDARLRSADPHLLAILEAHAGRVRAELPRRDDTIASRAREACTEELRAQRGPTLSSIAKVLAVSDRTLQRRLADEGTSFGAVLDDARSALARAFIRDREVSLAEVAWLLGFSDQSTFTRAFKRWTGAAPGEWRKTA
jgi:AraC-like DNA-binding protein